VSSSIECRGCGDDSRFCNCEYQQESSQHLHKKTMDMCNVLDMAGIPYHLNKWERGTTVYGTSVEKKYVSPWDLSVNPEDVVKWLKKSKIIKRS
jgi:hypothetical protein